MKIAVTIPALNEELTIAKVINDFRKELPQADIYVFDNNSTDKTKEIALQNKAKVITIKRRGKGHVVREAFEVIEADFYVLVDADDTYPAEEVHKLLKPVFEGNCDMTIGSRLGSFRKENKKILHSFGNSLIKMALKFAFPTRVNDLLSGYRAMSRDFVKNVNLLSTGFTIETELTVKALEEGYKIIEIPISYRERPEGSKSKLKSFSDGYSILQAILHLFRDYRPFQFFLVLSFVSFAIAAGFGYNVAIDFINFGQVKNLTDFIFMIMFILIAIQLLIVGFLASSIRYHTKEMINEIRKNRRIYGKK